MFETIRVTPQEYLNLVPDRRVFFNEPTFTELNKDKTDDVHYLIIKKENSLRFGLILGEIGQQARIPFSAPYAYPVPINSNTKIDSYDESLKSLEKYCVGNKISEIRFVFPPFFYDEDILTAWTSAMYRSGYKPLNIDINYRLDLTELYDGNYEKHITSNARNHLKKAIKSGIRIINCETEEDQKKAYNIIVENHKSKNRPTRMSFEQLLDTCKLTNHWFFLATIEEKPIASMIYYQITKDIVQCIYSGYLLNYSNSGVMNYLTSYTVNFFGAKNYKFIDRAIATEDSIPNYGLCEFKESVGGKRSLKYSFIKYFGEDIS